jgi:S-adenosylmethionine hydrolase
MVVRLPQFYQPGETNMTTLVKSLYLSLQDYGPDKGKMTGKIEFINQYGEITVRIGQERSGQILAILADSLVDTAKQTASLMTSEVLAQAEGHTLIEA